MRARASLLSPAGRDCRISANSGGELLLAALTEFAPASQFFIAAQLFVCASARRLKKPCASGDGARARERASCTPIEQAGGAVERWRVGSQETTAHFHGAIGDERASIDYRHSVPAVARLNTRNSALTRPSHQIK